MSVSPVPVWTGPKMRRSAEILAGVRDVQITWNFMRAMMAERTASSGIVARISDLVKDGYGRYKAAVVRSSVHHGHTMPVRAG